MGLIVGIFGGCIVGVVGMLVVVLGRMFGGVENGVIGLIGLVGFMVVSCKLIFEIFCIEFLGVFFFVILGIIVIFVLEVELVMGKMV